MIYGQYVSFIKVELDVRGKKRKMKKKTKLKR
jgi:hypothetical protein